jgi:hypothetical protein
VETYGMDKKLLSQEKDHLEEIVVDGTVFLPVEKKYVIYLN